MTIEIEKLKSELLIKSTWKQKCT